MSDILSQLSQIVNTRNLTRLQSVMDDYKLKRSEVAYLLDVSKSLVTRWFAQHKKCPDNAPELLRAIIEIRSTSSVRAEIKMKRRGK